MTDIKNAIKIKSQNNVIEEGHGKKGWYLDQLFLYEKINDWNKKTNNFVCLKEKNTGFRRLDRNNLNLNKQIRKNISNHVYSDYHCCVPMSKYSKINYDIYNLLSSNT